MSYAAGFGKKQTQIEYLISRHSDVEFKVKKVADGESLLETYTVTVPRSPTARIQPRCDCMAWISKKTRPCKHCNMVARFVLAGEPVPFSIEAQPKE